MTIDKRTEARSVLPPRRSEAANAGACQQPISGYSDQGVHSAAKREQCRTPAAALCAIAARDAAAALAIQITASFIRRRPQVNDPPCAPR